MLSPRPIDETLAPRAGATSAPPDELLLDSALWWIARAAGETFSLDRLWACFECGSCGARFGRTFRSERSPWTGGADAPLYRDLGELWAVLDRLATERNPDDMIDARDWSAAKSCDCKAPSHRSAVVATALFHSMVTGGAGLVALRHGEAKRCYSLAPGDVMEPIPATVAGIEEAFGRPLTLASTWASLLAQLPPDEGKAVGSGVERGVFTIAAHGREAVEAAAEVRLEGARRLVVFVDPTTVRSRAWPEAAAEIADHVEAGIAVALVVERDALVRRIRALARTHLGADIQDVDDGLELRTARFAWPVSDVAIVQNMAQLGRTLPEACALMLAMANVAGLDRLATLEKMVELVPGSFDVDGTRATGVRPDGSRGRTIDLTALPAFASSLPPEDLVREAAFLLDAAPAWADRTRVCPCGAAATVERRLVAWPWRGVAEAEPHVLETRHGGDGQGVAVVLALCCDRHVRVPAATEVVRLGLTPDRIEARLRADAPDAHQRVHFRSYPRADARPEVVVARGAHLSGIVLDDGRVAALHEALGRPFGDAPTLVAWALGTDRVALAIAGDGADERVGAVLGATGEGRDLELTLRREADLAAIPIGRFDVIRERG